MSSKKEKVTVLNTNSVGVIVKKGIIITHFFVEASLVVFQECVYNRADYYVEGEGEQPTSIFQYIEPESVEWFSEL